MKIDICHSLGLAALGTALVLRLSTVSATTSESTEDCYPEYSADGFCDYWQNNAICGYDGGDCCSCTCVSTDYNTCGKDSDLECIDPSASCVDDDDVTGTPEDYSSTTSSQCVPDTYSNGDCDPANNNSRCRYDGGDCCECTCVSGDRYTCGARWHYGYDCIDPSAECFGQDDDTTDDSGTPECTPWRYSNGICNDDNNTEECGYDGGDCCECTCVSPNSETFFCEDNSLFACIDPSAPCVDDDDYIPESQYVPEESTTTSKSPCVTGYYSDGECDRSNNNAECGYDGGDCCECTCVSTTNYTCGDKGGFACIDPSASCVDDDDITTVPADDSYTDGGYTTTGSCFTEYVSDGDCDEFNNNEGCGYDGGDCCECTCVSTTVFTCGDDNHGGFVCLDPSAECVEIDDDDDEDDDEDDDDMTTLTSEYSSDTDGDDTTTLASDDDRSDTGDTTDSCFGNGISDGACDEENNDERCGYDGGDCCECDCFSTDDFTCGGNGFNCVDPSSPCVNGYVLASIKTTITVSANAYDTRPGEASGDVGCGEDGCAPELTRDGISDNTESRWSCAQKVVPDGEVCELSFKFEDAQDIMEVQVAFYEGEERSRTLEAAINGEVIGEFDSYTGSTFNALGIDGVGVQTLTFTTVGLAEDDWISLVEVRFLVEP